MAVSNAVTMAVAVVMAEPLDLMDVMAAGASLGVPALAAGDRDARLGRTAAVEAAAASPATGQSAISRRDHRGRGDRRGSERAIGGRARLQARTCSPCPG